MRRSNKKKTEHSFSLCSSPQEWWSFDTCGAIVVGWNEHAQLPEGSLPDSDVARALEQAAYLAITTSLGELLRGSIFAHSSNSGAFHTVFLERRYHAVA